MNKYTLTTFFLILVISLSAQPSKLVKHLDSTRMALYPQEYETFDTLRFWHNRVEVYFRQYITEDAYVFVEHPFVGQYNESNQQLTIIRFGEKYMEEVYQWVGDELTYYIKLDDGKIINEEYDKKICLEHNNDGLTVIEYCMK